MLRIISNADQLREYQTLFIEQLDRARDETVPCRILWRPSFTEGDVSWSLGRGIWWYSAPLDNRWWNVFGIGRPSPGEDLQITCEINIPFRGINRGIAGAFAQGNDQVFVVHRGNRWGGGKTGITKALFWRTYPGNRQRVDDGGRDAEVATIGELGNPRLPDDVAAFVRWVREVKDTV